MPSSLVDLPQFQALPQCMQHHLIECCLKTIDPILQCNLKEAFIFESIHYLDDHLEIHFCLPYPTNIETPPYLENFQNQLEEKKHSFVLHLFHALFLSQAYSLLTLNNLFLVLQMLKVSSPLHLVKVA